MNRQIYRSDIQSRGKDIQIHIQKTISIKQKHFQNDLIPIFCFHFFSNTEYYIFSHKRVQTTTPVVHLRVGNLIPRYSLLHASLFLSNACLAHTFNSFPSVLPSLSPSAFIASPLVSVSLFARRGASLADLSHPCNASR